MSPLKKSTLKLEPDTPKSNSRLQRYNSNYKQSDNRAINNPPKPIIPGNSNSSKLTNLSSNSLNQSTTNNLDSFRNSNNNINEKIDITDKNEDSSTKTKKDYVKRNIKNSLNSSDAKVKILEIVDI